METDLLRYFLTVARTQSIRQSAGLIGITPAGLSKGIKTLEHKLGYALLANEGRGIRLTTEGEALATRLEPALKLLETALHNESAPEQSSTLRIATFEIFSTYILGKIWPQVSPEWKLELRELTPGSIESAVAGRVVDIGISINPAPHRDLTYLKVGSWASKIFVKRKSALAGLELGDLPFVVPYPPESGAVSRAIGLDGWPAEIARNISHRVSLLQSGLLLCSTGVAAGFFPEPVVALYNEVTPASAQLQAHAASASATLRKASSLDVFLVVRVGDEDTPAVRKLAKELRLITKLKTSTDVV